MRKARRNREISEVGVGTLRMPTQNATEEEVTATARYAHDNGTPKSTQERISSDGKTSNQSAVNLCKKNNVLRLGTWNVRSMNQLGKIELLLEELKRINLNIVGLCETRWRGEGSFNPDDNTTVVFCGKESGKHESGVAIILTDEARKALDSYTPVSDRIVVARLNAKPKPLSIIL